MTVDTISKNKIKIELTNEEIEIFFGGYEYINYSNPDSKLAINLLLKEALPQELLPLDCNRVMIEVNPTKTGCSILFTKVYTNPRKRYKVSGCIKNYILYFEDSEGMILTCKEFAQNIPQVIKSELYADKNGYYLALHGSNISRQLLHIGEFCNSISEKNEILAMVKENTKLICKDCAIEKIAKAF